MTRLDPATARPRTDLPWLRHRRLAPVVTAAAPTPRVTPPPVTAPPASPPGDLDLGPAPASTGSGLDLGPLPAPGANALDLGPPSALATPGGSAAPTPVREPAGAHRPSGATYRPRRVRAGDDVLLTRATPTLTLTRLQAGTGAVRVRLVVPAALGDLRLGCAYELVDGTSLVQRVPGPQTAPPDGRRPVIRASHDAGGELVTVDLVQVRRFRRMVVYAWSGSGQPVTWGGTLVVEMLAGTRVRIPLDRAPGPPVSGVLVPLSVYQVDGELVLRNEAALVDGRVRSAALAFGFDRITWVDDDTPLI